MNVKYFYHFGIKKFIETKKTAYRDFNRDLEEIRNAIFKLGDNTFYFE